MPASANITAPSPFAASSLAVSVIVPTFREAANLPELVPAVSKSLAKAEISHEIIIVDDNSRDGTDRVVATLAEQFPVSLLTRVHERGLASAVVHGFNHARGDILVCMDADLSHPPEKLPELVQPILQNQVDFVLGSRYVPGATTDEKWNWKRRLNSRVATVLAWPLTSVRDPMSGFFALPKDNYLAARDSVNPIGYKIGLELLIKTGAKRTCEVPIHFRDRAHGQSKLGASQRIAFLRHVLQLVWHRARSKRREDR